MDNLNNDSFTRLANGSYEYGTSQSSEKKIILKPRQIDAVSKIEDFFSKGLNPICGYPPGEGKTYIAGEMIKRLLEKKMQKILVVVKVGNLDDPWSKALKHFSIPFSILHGKDRRENYLIGDRYELNKPVLLTTYDTALLDLNYLLVDGGYDLIVFDELHTIINPKKLTQKSIEFAKLKSKYKLALTATAIQNTPEDIGLMYIILNKPDMLFVKTAGENMLKDESLKWAKEEVKNTEIVIIPNKSMSKEYRIKKVILSVPYTKEMHETMENNAEISKIIKNERKYLSFLSHPASLYYFNSPKKINISGSKEETVKMIVEKTDKSEKVVIFSCFIDVLNSYYSQFKEEGYESIIITGKDRGNEIEKKLSQFRQNKTFKILLTTFFKSAEGLNLDIANHVIILEFWWNPQKIFQAMGRIDRLNQEKDGFIYLLCCNDNGMLDKKEKRYFKTMKKKIEYSRSFIPMQENLPAIKVFKDENNFKNDLSEWLDDFKRFPRNPQRVVCVKKKEFPKRDISPEIANTKETEDNNNMTDILLEIFFNLSGERQNISDYYSDIDLKN